MADVVLEQVRKVYPGGVVALAGLDLRVADGELLVLVGPSGSGKTTVLRLVAGLETPTAGSVRIGGQVVNNEPPHARGVAFVFQRPALYPHLTVRDNLAFGLVRHRSWLPRWLGGRANVSAAAGITIIEVAEALHLTDLLDRRPGELSGGQQQRVALGRALARRPGVLLLDEPFSGLEPALRREMRRQLHLLRRRLRATMLYVTHDPEEAMTLGDQVAVLDRGALQQAGPPLELYRRPHNRFVASFLGWPPAGFLEGRLTVTADGLSFCGGPATLPLPPRRRESWGRFAGRAVTLGLRADRVRWGRIGTDEVLLTMRVELVERLGAVSLVHLVRGDWQLAALQTGPTPTPGDTVEAVLDLAGATLFDAGSGQTLAHDSG
jgi:multiple sugar transport system ATP-binding protein